jgi:hypothetical protein
VLPLPHIRPERTERSKIRSALARVNDYTLWAFNPQPPLAYRPTHPRGTSQDH